MNINELSLKKRIISKFKKTSILDNICENINNKCIQACKCYMENNNIVRVFDDNYLYNWEIVIYFKLIDTSIVPLINSEKDKIVYILNDYIPLRTFLFMQNNKNNEIISLILNELYSFINMFKKYSYIHGNLHIDNILIKKVNQKYEFKVIDFVNSYILYKENIEDMEENFTKTSFICEWKKKENKQTIQYWDFFTIYISLINFFKKSPSLLYIIQNIMESYIPYNIFNNIWNEIMKNQV
jgi:hypothetical protein